MGKIIRNGVEFSGTLDNAANVNYNNELSGMEATTVQEAIDEINESLANVFPVPDFSNQVDLKPYTEGEMYTFPEDGYLYIDSGWNNDNTAHIGMRTFYDGDKYFDFSVQAHKGYTNTALIPVKKDWATYIVSDVTPNGTSSAKFCKILK